MGIFLIRLNEIAEARFLFFHFIIYEVFSPVRTRSHPTALARYINECAGAARIILFSLLLKCGAHFEGISKCVCVRVCVYVVRAFSPNDGIHYMITHCLIDAHRQQHITTHTHILPLFSFCPIKKDEMKI